MSSQQQPTTDPTFMVATSETVGPTVTAQPVATAAPSVTVSANPEDMMSFISTPGYSWGFFDCLSDPVTCLSVWCCSCLIVGQTSGKIHKNGQFDVAACLCSGIGAYRIRRKVQAMSNIQESEDASACAVGCCGCCAVVQDVRHYNKIAPGGKA